MKKIDRMKSFRTNRIPALSQAAVCMLLDAKLYYMTAKKPGENAAIMKTGRLE
jgi:hypothetical protein